MSVDDRFNQELREANNERHQGTLSDVITGPVSDWATDFSHADPEWAADPFPIQDDLRQRCPIAHTERFGGVWLPTRYDDVASIAYDTERFSSRSIVISNFRPSADLAPVGGTPPISSDPPFHHDARKLLLPAFTKTAIGRYEESTRAFCHSLIDAFDGQDVADAAEDYAKYIPMRVIGDMLGLPPEDNPRFGQFVEDVIGTVALPPEERGERLRPMFDYMYEQVREHVENPRDDLTTHLINAELYGRKLDPAHVVGTIVLLLIAGIDTTWSAIGASLWHLATHPADRERLVASPDLLPTAMEEFLRAYAPVTMARLVKEDMRWRDVDMKADDWILLSFPAANRDPAQFDQAGQVVIDREVNRHAAFGLGIHRCVGSHLARMELRVALEVWLSRVPEFSLSDPSAVTWSTGQIRGPRTLPLRIN
ncbi:MAG: cytochrome P450 [Trebonia sp.]|jgi:cytochrome P450